LESGEYKISRPFLMLYKEKNIADNAKEFIDFVISKNGQNIIEQRGYLAVHPQ